MNRLTLLVTLLLVTGSLAQEPDYEAFFNRSSGWTGADGTYSLPYGEDATLWGFSDTFFGQVENGRRLKPFRFVNNSFVLQRAEKLAFLKAPVFSPPDRIGWFWLFDGLVTKNQNQILLGQFRTNGLGGAFGFEQCGLWWARFEVDEKNNRVGVSEYRKLPFYLDLGEGGKLITFGSAITQVGPWAYIYGIRQNGFERKAIVARAPSDSLGVAGTWRFHDGKVWQRDPKKAVALFDGASVEYSVHQTASGEFVYIGSAKGGMGGDIIARKAPAPYGPWSDTIAVATSPEHKGTVFCYNAKAHPELSQGDKLLISYNVNTTDLNEVVEKADIYRPRFVWWTPPSKEWLP